MEFDEFLQRHLGECGRYQRLLLFFIILEEIFGCFQIYPVESSLLPDLSSPEDETNSAADWMRQGKSGWKSQVMSPVFLIAVPDHWCDTPVSNYSNCTHQQQMAFAIPVDETPDGASAFTQCSMYDRNYSSITPDDVCPEYYSNKTTNEEVLRDQGSTIKCDSWIYNREMFSENIVTEWDLVCGKQALVANFAAVYMIGRIAGSVVFGQLADRLNLVHLIEYNVRFIKGYSILNRMSLLYHDSVIQTMTNLEVRPLGMTQSCFGRRPMMLFTGLLQMAVGVASAFAPNFMVLLVLRFFLAFFCMGKMVIAFIQVIEFAGPQWRVPFGCFYMIAWATGYPLLAGIAYLVRDWRILQLVTAAPEVIYFLIYFLCVPESPRWLLVKNRHEEAHRILRKAAHYNRVKLPEKLELTVREEKDSGNILDLFRVKTLRWVTLNMCFNWFANGFVYYGLSLNTSNLGGNPFLNFCISGAVEIPAYLFILWSFSHYGRILPFSISMLIGGVSLIMTIPTPSDLTAVIITLSMVGKFFIAASFAMDWIYSAEVYPTVVRSSGFNCCNASARIAATLAAFVNLLGSVHAALPPAIFGGLAVIAGGLVLILPETRGYPLTQTVEEADKFIKTKSCTLCKGPRVQSNMEAGTNVLSSGSLETPPL